jgi:type II secretory pathway pseudopilin PulG
MKREEGVTLVEVVVAALVLVLGALAVLGLVTAAARNSFRAEQSQVVANRLQDELEKFRQLADNANYDRIALTSAPTASSDPHDPAYRVNGSTYAVNRGDPDRTPPIAPSGYQSMVIDSSGIAPTSQFSSGDVQGTIHRYVVWEPSSACPTGPGCLKRLIVSIALDPTGSGGVRRYQEMQTLIGDPSAQQGTGDTCSGSGCDPTPWTFWLTDTPCGYSDREPIPDTNGDGVPDSHSTHNTRGDCSKGLQDSTTCTTVPLTGITSCPPGAPDLMVTHPPPVFSEEPLVNFATDVLSPDSSLDKGLRTFKPGTDGCPLLSQQDGIITLPETAIPGSNPTRYRYQEIHKWLSPPIPNGFTVALNGSGSLNLWTRTIGGASYAGRICVWLFQRQLSGGVLVDTPAVNLWSSINPPPSGSCDELDTNLTYFRCTRSPWPSDKWTEVNIPLSFTVNFQLAPQSRLGLAVAVEQAGTPIGGGLQFIYDEPSYESRLEVKTTSQLPF